MIYHEVIDRDLEIISNDLFNAKITRQEKKLTDLLNEGNYKEI
jgi:hypothetical protein